MSQALAILAAVLAVSALIVIHEAGHFLAARRFGMKVERFSVGFGPVLLRVQRGETEFALSALPFGGYVKIAGMAAGDEADADDPRAFVNQPAWRRFLVILAGPAMNYVGAALLAALLLATAGLAVPDASARVGDVEPGKPAALGGLVSGDRVLEVDGQGVTTFLGIVEALQRTTAAEVPLLVERGDERLTLTVRPVNDGGTRRLFFGPATALETRPPGAALVDGFRRTNAQLGAQLAGFGQLFAPKQSGVKLEGPVGIAKKLVRAAQRGAAEFFSLAWLVSVVLAVLNLLPVPALDGGRLVFLGYEIVTRRRPNAKLENTVNLVGALALIALMLGVTVFKDLLGR